MTSPDTPVSAVMTPDPITVGPEVTVREAIRILESHPFRHLPVTEGSELVGILSDRDLLLTPREEAKARWVRDLMQRQVHTATPQTPLGIAACMLHRERIGALPIVVGSSIQGIVTETDILIAFRDHCRTNRKAPWARARVRDHMSAPPLTVDYGASLADALELCRSSHIRHLPVLREGRLHGILSDRDLRRGMAAAHGTGEPGAAGRAVPVAEMMTTGVMVISPDSALTAAVFTMATNKVGALPVLRGDEVVGIISQSDVLACYARTLPPPERG